MVLGPRRQDRAPNEGWRALRPGQAAGRIIGGNLGTLNLLQGIGYMSSLGGALLMIEDDATSGVGTFARNLTSLLQLPDASKVQSMVIGRFQKASGLIRYLLEQIIVRQDRLAGSPVLGNVDFGHTNPLATFPIGGRAELAIGSDLPRAGRRERIDVRPATNHHGFSCTLVRVAS